VSDRASSLSRTGKKEAPPYAKYAFVNPYNLSLLAGAGSASLLTGHWWIGLCAVAAEAVWMLFAPDSRLLQKTWFDPIWDGEQRAARLARQSAKFNALPDLEKERALKLRDQQKRIEKMAKDNTTFTVELLSQDIAKLEDLVDDFLDMASVSSRYESYLKEMDLADIEQDIRRYSLQAERLPIGDERRTVAQKNLEVLLSRKDRYMELRRSLQTARGQMDLMENTFLLLADEIVGMQNPTELGARLDGLREGVAAVRETSKETERYMQAASR
jgi:hypothetical protein